MTLFEALTCGAFDHLNRKHSGEFDQNFLKKSNAPGFVRGGGGGGMSGFGIDWYIIHSLSNNNQNLNGQISSRDTQVLVPVGT